MLTRRKFLGLAGGVTAAGAAGFGGWQLLVRDHVEEAATGGAATPAAGGRVLVVLQLAGGNDGLNTLVPAAGRYRDARPTLALPEAGTVALAGVDYRLHAALAPLAPRFDAGQVAALQGIGLPQQSRSHFQAMDRWWAGTAGPAGATGWLGRWLDATEAATPNPLRAIALGTGSPALVGERSVATVVLSPREFALRTPRGTDAAAVTAAFAATAAPLAANATLASAQAAVPDALRAIDALAQARAEGQAAAPAEAVSATNLLDAAAGLIELDLGTRVIYVGVGGFDTHADQLDRHDALWRDAAGGLAAFLDRLDRAGRSEQVLVITTSEFGRRVAENGSGGTDHGLGGVQLAMGAGVHGGVVVGELGLDGLVDGDLPVTVDARSLYAIALDWLGGPTDELLGGSFDRYALI